MTVSSTVARSGPYQGNGVAVTFGYGFKIESATHLTVVMTQSGVDTIVDPSAYSVTNVGNEGGGSIIFTLAPAVGQAITIIRNVPFTQETDLENQGAYYAETVEDALDLAVMRDQQLEERLDRAVQIPVGADPSVLPGVVQDVLRLAESADNIDIVANNVASVNTVAAHIANVDTVAGHIANVDTVAGHIANVDTVAAHAANVDIVAVRAANVDTVAGNIANVNTVAGISANVTAVAGVASSIPTVAANVTDISNFADVYQGPKSTDPTTRNDSSALHQGDLYFNTSSKLMRVYDGAAWKDAAAQSLNIATKSFVGNGSQTAFTLNVSPGVVSNILVEVGGVLQVPTADYTVSGTTLTFTSAPANGVAINTWVIFTISTLGIPADGSVKTASFAASATFNQSLVAGQFFTDINANTRVHRMNDRVFMGTSVAYDGKQNPSSGDWSLSAFPISGRGAYAYMPINAVLSVGAPSGQLAGAFYSRASDGLGNGTQASIGVSSFVVNDNNIGGGADTWAYYGTTVRTSVATGVSTYGVELDVANLGTTVPIYPNAMFQPGQTGGISICAGGELGSYTGATLGVSSFALGINQNDPTGNAKWEKGIVFSSKSIVGTDGATGTGIAIAFAKGHMLQWYNNSNQKVAAIFASGSNAANEIVQRIEMSDSGTLVTDALGNVQFRVNNGIVSAANYLSVSAAGATTAPQISALGSDANIDIRLTPKGTGFVNFTNAQVVATAGTQAGYVSIKLNGTQFKVPYYNL